MERTRNTAPLNCTFPAALFLRTPREIRRGHPRRRESRVTQPSGPPAAGVSVSGRPGGLVHGA